MKRTGRMRLQVGYSGYFVAFRIADLRVVFCPVKVRISSGGPCGIAIRQRCREQHHFWRLSVVPNRGNSCLHDICQRLVPHHIKLLHHLHSIYTCHVMSSTATIPLSNKRISGGMEPVAALGRQISTHPPVSAKTGFETQEKTNCKIFYQQDPILR